MFKNAIGNLRFLILPLILLGAECRADAFSRDFVAAALERTTYKVIYNGAYFKMNYPNGDVPAHFGVCTDEVIRAYRRIGADLQVLVHEDMAQHFALYPSKRI